MTKRKTIAQYEILSELGRGGFAVVYRAHDTRVGRDVALKVIADNLGQDAAFVERFRREARAAAKLRHPHVVPIHDFGEDGGSLYLAMALIGEGRTLRDLLKEQAPLDLAHALPILAQLGDALDYLHRQEPPLVHRDIKPANVLLEGEGDGLQVVLADFGLVRLLETNAEITRSGAILGTAPYMAPEQADPKRWGDATPLTDVYALGVVAYELLTGRPPFTGDLAAVLLAQARDAPPSPLEHVPDLGDDLAAVLLRGLAKPPGERYPSATALVAALQEVAEARATAAEQEATLEQLEAQTWELLDAGQWLEALDRCTQMARLDPGRPAALDMLAAAKEGLDRQQAEALQRRRLEERYTEGLQLIEKKNWQLAIAALKEITAGNPDYRDVQERLGQARDELDLAQWYDQAIAHGEAELWAEACRVWIGLLRRRPGYRDGDAASRLLDAVEGLLSQYDEQAAQPRFHTSLARLVNENRIIWRQDGKEMVRVPAGMFLYGEKQTRELLEFWIDRTPVTNAEYARFVKSTGHEPPHHWPRGWGGERTPAEKSKDHPVVNVMWKDAAAYAEWAGKRLPSELEWEKAARGTNGRTYPWGDAEPTPETSNFGHYVSGTTQVGAYSPQGDSPYGCVDVAGNVWEWTMDGDIDGGRVARGGSWRDGPRWIRSTARNAYDPSFQSIHIGFRCAWSPE